MAGPVSALCPQINVQPTTSELAVSCMAKPYIWKCALDVQYIAAATGGTGNYLQYTWNVKWTIIIHKHRILEAIHSLTMESSMQWVNVLDRLWKQRNCTMPISGMSILYSLISTLNANAGGPYSGFIMKLMTFDASKSTGDIVSYVWNFGDGTVLGTGASTITHTYTYRPGIYNITLTVYDNLGNTAHRTFNCKSRGKD